MKKILVVGTKGDQPRRLSDRLRGVAEISCVTAERCDRKLPRSDHIFVWCKFVSHTVRQTLLDNHPSNQVSEHFGGVGELADKIAEFVREDAPPKMLELPHHHPARMKWVADHAETLAV